MSLGLRKDSVQSVNALPNAAFIGFTGTPLMAGEELTKKPSGIAKKLDHEPGSRPRE